jgi:hypothetical protein
MRWETYGRDRDGNTDDPGLTNYALWHWEEALDDAAWLALQSKMSPPKSFDAALASAFSPGCGKDPALSRLPYSEYLRTPHWQAIRTRVLQRADGICKRCHVMGRRLDVHHLTYDRLGREREWDLRVLCDACHAAEHRISFPVHNR